MRKFRRPNLLLNRSRLYPENVRGSSGSASSDHSTSSAMLGHPGQFATNMRQSHSVPRPRSVRTRSFGHFRETLIRVNPTRGPYASRPVKYSCLGQPPQLGRGAPGVQLTIGPAATRSPQPPDRIADVTGIGVSAILRSGHSAILGATSAFRPSRSAEPTASHPNAAIATGSDRGHDRTRPVAAGCAYPETLEGAAR